MSAFLVCLPGDTPADDILIGPYRDETTAAAARDRIGPNATVEPMGDHELHAVRAIVMQARWDRFFDTMPACGSRRESSPQSA